MIIHFLSNWILDSHLFIRLPDRAGVQDSFSSPEIHGRDGGFHHPVLCEGHHCVMDHASERDEVSKATQRPSIDL